MYNKTSTNTPCRLWVGTSGYSYAEWADAGFYPPGTKSGNMLPFYAQNFPITELNFTWYQMPKARTLERMHRQAPADFRFAAKLTRTLTHEIDPGQWRGQAAQYRDGIAPLIQARKLAAILLQFPPSFVRAPQNRRYLAALLDELDGLPLAVEFRHASWATDRVFAELERRRSDDGGLAGSGRALHEHGKALAVGQRDDLHDTGADGLGDVELVVAAALRVTVNPPAEEGDAVTEAATFQLAERHLDDEAHALVHGNGQRLGLALAFAWALGFGATLAEPALKAAQAQVDAAEDRIEILLDRKSLVYLRGVTLDFQGGLSGRGFQFQNPNAANTCGCGESFTV